MTPDDLVSGYIDDDLNDEQRAWVESDPVLRQQVLDTSAAIEAMGEVVPTPAEVRERQIDEAMQAFRAEGSASSPNSSASADGSAPPPSPFTPPPPKAEGRSGPGDGDAQIISLEHRRQANRRVNVLVGAAGVVVLAGLGVLATIGGNSGGPLTDNFALDRSADEMDADTSAESFGEQFKAGRDSGSVAAEAGQREAASAEEASDESMEYDSMEDDDSEESDAADTAASGLDSSTTREMAPIVLDAQTSSELLSIQRELAEGPLRPTAESVCADSSNITLAGRVIIGYVPVVVGDTLAELIVMETSRGDRQSQLLTVSDCRTVELG